MRASVDIETVSPTGRLIRGGEAEMLRRQALQLQALPNGNFVARVSGGRPLPEPHELQAVSQWLAHRGTNHRQRVAVYRRAATLAKLAGLEFADVRVWGPTGKAVEQITPERTGQGWLALDHPARAEALFDVMRAQGDLVRPQRPGSGRR